MFLRKAVTLIRNVIVGGSDKSYQTCKFECDSASDLPAQDQTTYMIDIGSEAHDIDQNATYMMKSNGTWTLQEAGTAAYTKAETDALLADKADKSTTYTKTQTDNLLAAKADASSVYTKTQTDNLLAAKANSSDVYTKSQTQSRIQADVFGVGNNTYIADASDMDSFTTAGVYIRQYSSGLSNFTHLPMNGSTYPYEPFKLVVEYLNSPNNILQTIIPTYSSCGYFRRMRIYGAGGTWQAWQYFSGTPV